MYCYKMGSSSFRPFRLRMFITNSAALLSSQGIPDICFQWSKKFCGKAIPWVFALSTLANPKLSATGRQAFTTWRGLPSSLISSTISPLLWLSVQQTPPSAWLDVVISHKNIGSSRVGLDAISRPWKSLREVGIIWAPFLWTASAWILASTMLNRQPLVFYSASTPVLLAYWKAVQTESLISVTYCAPLTMSTSRLAPIFSGPKHQIFWASVLSQLNYLHSFSALSFGSPLGSISSDSILATSSFCRGADVPKSLLCLLADLVSNGSVTSEVMVSLQVTMGAETMIQH